MDERELLVPFQVEMDPMTVIGQAIRFRMSGDSWAHSLAQALTAVRNANEDHSRYEGQELTESLSVAASYDGFLRNIKQAELISQEGAKPVSDLIKVFPAVEQAQMVAQNYEDQITRKELIEKDPLGIELLEYCLYQELENAANQDPTGKLRRRIDEQNLKAEEILGFLKPRHIGSLQAFEHYVNVMNSIKNRLDAADKEIARLKAEEE